MYCSTKKMKVPSLKTLWITYAIGSLSPILALIIKPEHYSFYMFFPATPGTFEGRTRLLAADSLLVMGFIIVLLATILLVFKGVKQKRYFVLLCPVVALANPFHQPLFLESLDTHMNYQWRDKAEG